MMDVVVTTGAIICAQLQNTTNSKFYMTDWYTDFTSLFHISLPLPSSVWLGC